MNEQVRGQAWVNRTHAYAAWITPDDHPDKRYVADKLAQRMLWYPAEYTRNDKRGGPASYETAGWIQGPHPAGVISNWQQDFFAQSLSQAMRMQVPEARDVYNFTRRYQLNRFLRADFNGRWSTAYRVIHSDEKTKVPFRTWREIAQVNIAAGKFEANPAEMMGNPDAAWNYVAQARAGYASMIGAFADPLMAGAYAVLVRNTLAMQEGRAGFAVHPQFSIVPVFPDGTILSLADHRAVNGRAQGSARNDLLAGGPRPDMLLGGDGNDILAGQGGDDTLAGGSGFNLLSGGRGDDRLVAEGGITLAAGGPGADTFYVGRRATGGPAPLGRLEITDFTPGTDRLSLPPALGDARAVLRGARAVAAGTLIPLGQGGGSILLRGVAPGAVRADSFAMR